MKVILVDQRHGHTRTIVLKGWLKGLLSLCILGAPVAFGYLGYQVSVAGSSQQYTLATAADPADEIESPTDAQQASGQETFTYTQHQFLPASDEQASQNADRAQQRNGYIARFEHSDKFLASLGDVIRQGQLIELASDTGIFTGSPIRFDVYRHGRVVDPAAYLQRTER
jgi:hypothetical protein